MKISVPETRLAAASVQQVDIGEVRLGPVRIGQLSLNGVALRSSSGVAQLRNVRVALQLKFALDWSVGLVIDAGPFGKLDFTQKGKLDLGQLALGIGLGHLTLPGLARLALEIPKLPVNDLSVLIGPLKALKLGPLLAERIRAQGLAAPPAGFTLAGLGLGGLAAEGITLPAAALEGVSVGRVAGGTLPLPGLSLPQLSLPEIKVPRLASEAFAAASKPIVTPMPPVDAGLMKATLTVTTTAGLDVDELRVDDLRATASADEIVLKNVELPYEVLDLRLSQLGIERVEVPALKVS